ncbi:hypothetical protein [Litchfieldia salsa]|nr:hypothetical protein [Litchfieldia salsa]
MKLFHAPQFFTLSLAVIMLCTMLLFIYYTNDVTQRNSQIQKTTIYEIHPSATELFKQLPTSASKL